MRPLCAAGRINRHYLIRQNLDKINENYILLNVCCKCSPSCACWTRHCTVIAEVGMSHLDSMLRSSLRSAGRLTAALRQARHQPVCGSVPAASQVRTHHHICCRLTLDFLLITPCALQCVLRDFSTNSHDIFNVVRPWPWSVSLLVK